MVTSLVYEIMNHQDPLGPYTHYVAAKNDARERIKTSVKNRRSRGLGKDIPFSIGNFWEKKKGVLA